MMKIVKKCNESNLLNLVGFHCHIGSSICNPEHFEQATQTMLDFLKDVIARTNTKFSVLNLGGGFGIKYTKDEKNIEIKDMMKVVSNHLDNVLKNQKIIVDNQELRGCCSAL